MTIAEALAERIASVRYDALPEEAVHWARVAIIDTVGCTLAGASEPCARIVARVTASDGPCLIFGTEQRVAPLDAALINGTASHALDFDDCSDTLGGHPSAPILPALFALAETRTVDGRAFIAAYVAGWETETRIARGVNFHHYEKGWHPTATLGVFGSTAACCHLLGLTPEATATALGLAASFASGVKANFGTMTKPLHVGHCSRNGMLAALLAADGFTANAGALEHRQGFLHVFNGEGNFDADAILRDWGQPWDIVQPGVAIKQYPCCGSTHPAVDAMLIAGARARADAGDGGTRRTHGRIRGGWRTPTGRTRRASWMPSSACSTAWRARCWIVACRWSISRATASAIPRSACCCRVSTPRRIPRCRWRAPSISAPRCARR